MRKPAQAADDRYAEPSTLDAAARLDAMRVVSVNVSLPREVIWRGKRVTTGIFKEPVEGPVTLRTLNLDGDR